MTKWTARVEWTRVCNPGDTEVEDLLDALSGHHPAVEFDHAGTVVTMSAIITLNAETLRQATTIALHNVETVTGQTATGIEVLTADEHKSDDRLGGQADTHEAGITFRPFAGDVARVSGFIS